MSRGESAGDSAGSSLAGQPAGDVGSVLVRFSWTAADLDVDAEVRGDLTDSLGNDLTPSMRGRGHGLGWELLEAVHVATMDCGGITYSGDEYVAAAATEAQARQAVARLWLAREGEAGLARLDLLDTFTPEAIGEDLARLADELDDHYTVSVAEVPFGGAVARS